MGKPTKQGQEKGGRLAMDLNSASLEGGPDHSRERLVALFVGALQASGLKRCGMIWVKADGDLHTDAAMMCGGRRFA